MGRLESEFQSEIIRKLRYDLFPGCIVTRGNSASQQGIPDVFIVYYDKWAMLEFKKSANEPYRPNQPYFVELFNEWSFAAFIFPENAEEVLRDLQHALRPRRKARISQRQ
jgi:hypothetical protein